MKEEFMNGSFVKMKESELRIFYHDTDIDVPEHLVDVRDAARILEKVFDLTHQAQELLCAMFMDNTNRIVGIEKVHVGDVNRVSSSTHEIFKRCLLHNATRVLVCHNHPSDNAYPSVGDLGWTRDIVLAGHQLGIELVDHLVVAADKTMFSIIGAFQYARYSPFDDRDGKGPEKVYARIKAGGLGVLPLD